VSFVRQVCQLFGVAVFSFAIAATGISGHAQAAAEAGVVVQQIEVVGTKAIDPDAVRSGLTFKTGDKLTAQLSDQSIKRLFATGSYSDVRISHTGNGRIKVEVVENPRIGRITFEGNTAIDNAKLTAAIALKRGGIYTRTRARADETTIRELYVKEGRYHAVVSSSTTEDPRGGVDLVFKVVEGDIHKVESIEFAGNSAFTSSQLRDAISTTQSGWFDFLKGNATYNIKEQLEFDRVLLREYYQKHGYPDVTVSEAKSEKLPSSNGFRIAYTVDEGDKFTFGAQRVESVLEGIDTTALSAEIVAMEGRIYDISKIEATVSAMSIQLAKDGHPFVRVSPKIERDANRRVVAITYKLENGPQRFIARIEISGNVRTQDYVVRRELKLNEGDAFNTVLAEASRKRLLRTGFFKTVELKPERAPEPDRINLHVVLVEQETGDLSFGLGYSQNAGVIGDVSYSERNIMGTGIAGKVKLELGERRYGAEIGLTDPRFLGSNNSAGFDLFYRDIDRTLQSSYKEQRLGGSVRIGIPITDTITTGLNYTFTRSTLYNVGDNASAAIKDAVPGFPKASSSTYDTSSVGYSTIYDTRDKTKLPTSGLYSVVKQDFAGLGGDAAFVRTSTDVRGYVPVTAGIVLSGHLGGGYIGGYGGQDVRLLDLYYRGSETVRGFAVGGIGPRDSNSLNQDALGGRAYYSSSLEVRTPLPFAPASLGLSAVGFVDAGSLFSANKTASALPGLTGNSAAPRISTGVGLVWDSPLGPLQASYGFALSKQPGDKVQPFNFGVGSGF
jgi:outer membrane protein insertion porin family